MREISGRPVKAVWSFTSNNRLPVVGVEVRPLFKRRTACLCNRARQESLSCRRPCWLRILCPHRERWAVRQVDSGEDSAEALVGIAAIQVQEQQ